MNSKILLCVGVICSLWTAPALAVPSLIVDLLRDGSNRPILDASGNWQWLVQVNVDSGLFGPVNEGGGTGGSVATEIGFEALAADLISAAVDVSNFGETDGDNIVEAGEGTPNPGESIFGWETTIDVGGGNMRAVGLQTDGNEVFSAFGSRVFNTGGPKNYLTIVTDGPNTSVSGSLTTTLAWLGSQTGNAGLLIQSSSAVNVSGSKSATAHTADANLDGRTNIDDLVLLAGNFNNPATWAGGNFNGDAIANIDDLVLLAGAFNTGSGIPPGVTPPGAGAGLSAGGAVPEPSSLALLALGGLLAAGRRRR